MNRLLAFMKSTGAGKTTSKSLSRDDARQAMAAILEGAYHPVTLGAFLLALRYKGESEQELAGFLDAMAERLVSAPRDNSTAPLPNLLDCAASYDGKVRTLNTGVAATLVAVGAGARIVCHGADNIPTKCGMTTAHVLKQLGIEPQRTPQQALTDLPEGGIFYLHQPDFHPDFHALLANRLEVGKRTVLNTLEPLSNPLGARSHLGGFFHDTYGPLTCEAAAMATNGFDRILMVKGIEGSDELRPGAMHFLEWRNGRLQTIPVDSAALGLNAAVRLYAAEVVPDLQQGIESANASLHSGAALQVLRTWQVRQAKSRLQQEIFPPIQPSGNLSAVPST